MFILDKKNSIANHFLYQLRDSEIQKDRFRFRKNLERLGEIMAYEISKSLPFYQKSIKTPLGNSSVELIKYQPVLISVLRAAIPFYQGFLNFFDDTDSGFIGAYRKGETDDSKNIEIDYLYQAAPSIEGREVILIDPMLATGKSFIKTIENLYKNGNPSKIHIASVIAAPEGIDFLQKNTKQSVEIWICSLDEKLNDKSYIIPGLGDAGDLSFGVKL
ncbi:uracil phosphoribosyltransferase [Aquiflexum balticum DSM 16537]|uniref:Uracil phosphoribosyltransferase n=1 Tax=Aquiflexum balticum DSM 16537 TaxID=758820 RepID=A0A1W2H2R8_9BACT|nr:uracil phosphoribosyltransferase [Aquiflexum balticum]SMD43159.1 uracil phosphoribosyltransferase [Aquiflexum balticum DSM 16537]